MLNWHRRDITPFPREAFSPAMLFRSGADGLWPDPSDILTMFQDSAGTLPVTAPGQTVGLMLDKSRGLVKGVDAIANGPTTVPSPWVSLGGNRYSIDGSQASYVGLYYEGVLDEGETYEVTFNVESSTGVIRVASQLSSVDITGTGEKRTHLNAAVSNLNIQAAPGVAATIEVRAARKVPGNHLTQPTASKRPIYGVVPSPALAYLPEVVPDRWLDNPTDPWGGSPAVQFVRDDTHAKQGTHSLQFASGPAGGFYDMFSLTDLEVGEVVTYGVWVYRADGNANGDFGWSLTGGWGVVSLDALPVGEWTYITATAASPVSGASDLELRDPDALAIGNLWFDGLTIKRHKQGGRRNLLLASDDFSDPLWAKSNNISYETSGEIAGHVATEFSDDDPGYANFNQVLSGAPLPDPMTLSCLVEKRPDATSLFAMRMLHYDSGGAAKFAGIAFNTDTGEILAGAWNDAVADKTVEDRGDHWFVSVTAAGAFNGISNVHLFPAHYGVNGAVGGPFTGTHRFAALQIEAGGVATPYQRVGNAYDVTEAGIPTLHYLSFDGVDDNLYVASRFGMAANPDLLASFGVQPGVYGGTVSRLLHIGDFNARTLGCALGTEGVSWRFNDGNRLFGPLPSGENATVSFLRNAGDTYGASRAFANGEERAEVSAANTAGTPNSLVEKTFLGSSDGTDYYIGKMFGAVILAGTANPTSRGQVERYLARKSGVAL